MVTKQERLPLGKVPFFCLFYMNLYILLIIANQGIMR